MHDLVAALDRVLDRVAEVGERGPERQGLLEALTRRRHARLRRVLDEVGREELIDEPEVALVQDFERDALDSAS